MYDFDAMLAEYKAEFGDDIEDDLDLVVGGWDFLERVAFSFVRANFPQLNEEKKIKRVSRIVLAITGSSMIFPATKYDDKSVLNSMANAHLADLRAEREDASRAPRSSLELARAFAHLAGGESTAVAIKRLKKNYDKRERELLANCDDRAVAIEVLQMKALEQLEMLFEKFGVKFQPFE